MSLFLKPFINQSRENIAQWKQKLITVNSAKKHSKNRRHTTKYTEYALQYVVWSTYIYICMLRVYFNDLKKEINKKPTCCCDDVSAWINHFTLKTLEVRRYYFSSQCLWFPNLIKINFGWNVINSQRIIRIGNYFKKKWSKLKFRNLFSALCTWHIIVAIKVGNIKQFMIIFESRLVDERKKQFGAIWKYAALICYRQANYSNRFFCIVSLTIRFWSSRNHVVLKPKPLIFWKKHFSE